jgi:hypothetical protein
MASYYQSFKKALRGEPDGGSDDAERGAAFRKSASDTFNQGSSPGVTGAGAQASEMSTSLRAGESAGRRPAGDIAASASEALNNMESPVAKVVPGDYVIEDTGNKASGAKYVYTVSDGKVSFKSPIHGKMVTLSANETDPKRMKAYAAIMSQVAAASKTGA